ncbi:MAG: GNAT family N-acetyltransferase [Gammaproteobacteria bacterium]|nr:GNAT family N-acetyltransferase [Gammaproteobacteria bacterium]
MQIYQDTNIRLKDQHCVKLGLVGPEDRQRLLNGFKKISARTNINRFHTFKKCFTEDELQYLLVIDNVDHLAIGAVDCQNPDIGVGLARYVRSEQHHNIAEVAIIVIDEYQSKGLGITLYTELMRLARQNGIRYLRNIVGKDNRGMLALLKKVGAKKFAEDSHDYEFVVDLELD